MARQIGGKMAQSVDQAQILGLQALTFITSDEALLSVFLAASGASGGDLAQGARSPVFLAAVLDFLLLEDATVIAFCDAQNLPYDALIRARLALPGSGADDHFDF